MKIANDRVVGFWQLSSLAIAVVAAGVLGAGAKAYALDVSGAASSVSVQPVAADQSAGDIEKTVSVMGDKAIESAQSAVKMLEKSGTTMTFDDLNAAKQALVRIETMIDIERRMAELNKLRGSVSARGSYPLASAIPASVLAPISPVDEMDIEPVKPVKRRASVSKVSKPDYVPASSFDISRIYGSAGKYTAVISSGGDDKHVRVGDKLSDGSVVKAITSSSVVVDGNDGSTTLRIKNVDMVYSSVR